MMQIFKTSHYMLDIVRCLLELSELPLMKKIYKPRNLLLTSVHTSIIFFFHLGPSCSTPTTPPPPVQSTHPYPHHLTLHSHVIHIRLLHNYNGKSVSPAWLRRMTCSRWLVAEQWQSKGFIRCSCWPCSSGVTWRAGGRETMLLGRLFQGGATLKWGHLCVCMCVCVCVCVYVCV